MSAGLGLVCGILPRPDLLVALAFAALPLLTSSNYIVGVALSALIFTVAAAALNLVYGFTGLLSFEEGRTASVFASFESPELQDLTAVTRDGVRRRATPLSHESETPGSGPVESPM